LAGVLIAAKQSLHYAPRRLVETGWSEMIDIDLDPQSSRFIDRKIAEGSYRSIDEVVVEALRILAIRDQKLEELRAHLDEGYRQSQAGLFVEDFSIERLIEELDAELDSEKP
jgi:antitoxin ParD1/3/4